ncbi:MAG: nucleotidyltransferase family protein [Chloroflexi bacterium]|nr:nucleotidyltransferase family protein [Chloroflexota bacterium]
MRSVGVVPAAGSAERFGGRKLLEPIDGQPLLDRTIASLLDGGVDEVLVVVPKGATELEKDVNAFLDPRVRAIENPDPSRGMFSSIQCGVAQVDGDAIVVLPGDMPFLRPETVAAVLAVFSPGKIVSPRFNGKRGHPVVLPATLRDEIAATDPVANLHVVIKKHQNERVDVDVDDRGVVRDVDVRADLDA